MADIKSLEFTAEGDGYISTFQSEGFSVVQLMREKEGYLHVYGSIGGMKREAIRTLPRKKGHIFDLAIPAGVEVTIKSGSVVQEAYICVDD